MDWSSLAMIVFSCTAVNHLGLIIAIENVIGRRLVIIDCPKCLTFWSTLLFGLYSGAGIITTIATALFLAYAAIWVELIMGFIDTLYNKVYEQIYPTADSATDS